eukprot:TRINITY_DN27839_c0_g1_i1.p1 TRINITY_DN27839_c0_g1~~TRINITY_DN27839_c0_g1_i1.p1  ORF type:complete len:225 (-),score=74.84 TRINITY_DN27839_c0_g1_i1:41-694(-)
MASTAKLPKLQLPKDETAQRKLVEASEVAREGDMKAAQKILKEAVADGLFPAPLQRQVIVWWSAGQYDLLPPSKDAPASTAAQGYATPAALAAPLAQAAPAALERSAKAAEDQQLEAEVVKLMREKNWSRKEACQYIDEGGLDMEAMRAEMTNPMDDAFEKLKAQGPPQWFIDAMTNAQNKAKEEGEGGQGAHDSGEGGDSGTGPAGPPVALGPPAE